MKECLKKCLVEFIGTFFLVFTVGSMLLLGDDGVIPAIAIGFVLMVMVYAGGHISGGHYNPAVSLAAAIRKALPWKEVVPYWISQILGACAAGLLILSHVSDQIVMNCPYSTQKLIVGEFLFTFALCYVVLNVATSKKTEGNSYFGFAIGATVTVGAFAAGSLCYCAFNPAVAIGLGVMKLACSCKLLITILTNLVAGATAALVYKITNTDEE